MVELSDSVVAPPRRRHTASITSVSKVVHPLAALNGSHIVEYPSRAEFFRIATSPEVQAIGIHREAGLAGQLLIPAIAHGA